MPRFCRRFGGGRAGRLRGGDDMQMPQDGAILLSMVNMKLRDGVSSPEELCEQLGWDVSELYKRLGALGCTYDEEKNRFA